MLADLVWHTQVAPRAGVCLIVRSPQIRLGQGSPEKDRGSLWVCIYIYIYIYDMCICICMYVYIYIYTYRERERYRYVYTYIYIYIHVYLWGVLLAPVCKVS